MKKNDTMKRMKNKLAAIVALLIGMVGCGFIITEYILYFKNPPDPSVKITLPDLQYLVKGLGYTALSAIPFAAEGIASIIRATRWVNRKALVLDIVSAVFTLGLIPMIYFSLADYVVWLCYYGIVFLAELILVILHITQKPPVNRYLPQMHT
jgi:hypothetical protein